MLAGSISSVYQEGIVDAGKEPAFLFFVAFLVSWAFIRTSAHMIRAQVSWWPGNVEVGGTHIHHLVWGIITLMISGWIAIAVDPGSPGRELVAIAFGIGTGLTLDEFALWLELKDVYWEQDGRKSIDAVVVAAILAGIGVLGFSVLIDVGDDVERAVKAFVAFFGLIAIGLTLVNAAKGKFGMAALGLVLIPVGLVAAVRLGKPDSLWARAYGEKKKARAEERFGTKAPPRQAAQDPPPPAGAGSGPGPGSGGGRSIPAVAGSPRRVGKTTPIEAATGIASRAPRMPRICAPASSATMATSGLTLTALP